MGETLRVGVDFGGTKIEAAALGAAGEIMGRRRTPTPRHDYEGCLRAVAGLVEAIEAQLGAPASVGVGMPGSISSTGLVRNANSTWLNGRRFDRDLETVLRRPVRIENDANCLALSEAADGAAAGRASVFGAILGTGCGGGLVIAGRLLVGRNRIAGEWGHNSLPWAEAGEVPGPLCWCGRRGCLETWISGPGLAAGHARVTGKSLRPEEIVTALRSGDEEAQASFRAWRSRLARGLAHVVNLLDPEAIVLGGGLSTLVETYDGLAGLVSRFVFSDRFDTPIVAAAHGDSSGLRGAARLWDESAE